MSTISDLRPGMIGFGPISGLTGAGIFRGQWLLGEAVMIGKLKVDHVFVVTRGDPGGRSFGIVEAMPSGARGNIVGGNRWNAEYAYVQLPEDYPGQSEDAAAIARAMIGTPYSFASYAALAAWRFRLAQGHEAKDGTYVPSRIERWIDRRKPPIPFEGNGTHADNGTNGFISLPREAICSVLADQAWALTGKQVMPHGTPHQCVTPAALARALLMKPSTQWLWPGESE